MKNLDIKTIVTRIRMLQDSSPVQFKGHDGEEKEIDSTMITAGIVGAAIACHCPIPARFVPTSSSYFASTYGEEIRDVLSRINEAVNIRTQVAYDAACSVWIDRFDMVHKPCDLDRLLTRLATMPDETFSNRSYVRPLIGSLNGDQKESLDKLVRSINLTCSNMEAKVNIFN